MSGWRSNRRSIETVLAVANNQRAGKTGDAFATAQRAEALRPFRLHAHRSAAHRTQTLGHHRSDGRKLRRFEDHGGVDVDDRPTITGEQLDGGDKQAHRVGTLPRRVGIGKVLSDVAQTGGPQQRIGHGMGNGVGVTVPDETWRSLDHDAAAIRFLQQWGGYNLTGDTRHQVLLFIHGPGGSGKSTAVNTIMAILGDYAVGAATSTLTAKKHEAHPEEIARLHGPRMALASETEKGSQWAESRIKQMTGGDMLTARSMYGSSFNFQPQFKLTIVGNNAPSLTGVGPDMRRRFMILPFDHPPAQKDDTLSDRLKAEWPGILSWLIRGCRDWQAKGLIRPAVLERATEAYFSEQDTFGQWLADCCDQGVGYSDTTANLYESWSRFAYSNGADPGSKIRAFPETMGQRGFKAAKKVGASRGRGYLGIQRTVENKRDYAGDFDED